MKYLKLVITLTILVSLMACELQNKKQEDPTSEKLLQLIEKSSLDKNVMTIISISDLEIDYYIEDGWLAGWKENDTNAINGKARFDPGDELCRGSGIGFARCVRDELDKGNCLNLYKEGDEYVAEETICQGDPGFQENP